MDEKYVEERATELDTDGHSLLSAEAERHRANRHLALALFWEERQHKIARERDRALDLLRRALPTLEDARTGLPHLPSDVLYADTVVLLAELEGGE